MSDFPAPRCLRCKTVLSPQWRVCQVCKASIPSTPTAPRATIFESLLKVGDRLVYRDKQTKQLTKGRVQRVLVQQQHLSITLGSGTTIQGRQISSMASINQDGIVTAARAVREEDLLMPVSVPPSSPQPEQPAASPPRSSWYHHWKEIATMTIGILPHEPRLTTIMTMIERCTAAFDKKDEPAFLRAKVQLANFIKASTPRSKAIPTSALQTNEASYVAWVDEYCLEDPR